MPVDEGKVIELLYVRGAFTAPHIASELGGGIEPIDVSICLLDLKRRGLAEDSYTSPPRWHLTETGNKEGWRRKARASG